MEFATDKESKVIVNGKIHTVSVSRLTYTAVCQLAGQSEGATVLYDGRTGHRSLWKGESVEVEPSLRFNVIMTDKA